MEEYASAEGPNMTSNGSHEGGVRPRDISDYYMEAGSVPDTGNKFHDVFQLKHVSADHPGANIVEMVKSSGIDNASTHSLFGVVNRILDECMDGKNGDISNHTAFILRKVLQIIEQRMSIQVDNFRNQKNFQRVREEKFSSIIKVLETLVKGTSEENEISVKTLGRIKGEKTTIEEKRKSEELNILKTIKEKDDAYAEVSRLNQELEMTKATYEKHCVQLETEARETKFQLEKKLNELESELDISQNKVSELEKFSESKYRRWKKKEIKYQRFVNIQCGALKDLREASRFMKNDILETRRRHAEELNYLGGKLNGLVDAARNYHAILAENRRLYNEIQDLKGNIRVYCRIRPFLPGQSRKLTTIEYIGENGELVVMNPIKNGKDNRRLFKFNKVFSPVATQEEVFLDTQPLIRSVLDGYNVCIFAYGQTGSGKTYTMSGPSVVSQEDWGVNYRALNDLFQIAQSRKSSIIYEVAVQMVEIYNEQLHVFLTVYTFYNNTCVFFDLHTLGIWSTAQPNGLAVPEASMHSVNTTADVLELMSIGLTNRAVGATALNERSSRSHSILTVHVRGTDSETNAILRGSLHLIDLAGSERVDRSEATGDRLREAQHINKSLSALGDVIFALAQKNLHVPYRNSKLTQVLQSSLGGQAKTLMFVQLNPDVDSFSETISTLKFAERVSGVELGASRSNKEGREVRELIEQVASLKDTIAKKDGEIERLLSPKHNKKGDRHVTSSLRYKSSSPRRHSIRTSPQAQRNSTSKISAHSDKTASDGYNCSEYSDRNSEAGSHQSVNEFRHQNDFSYSPSKLSSKDAGPNADDDVELLGLADGDSDRLSDISDSVLSVSTETDASISSIVEYTLFPETTKPPEESENWEKVIPPSKHPKPPQEKQMLQHQKTRTFQPTRSATRISSSARKSVVGSSSSTSSKLLSKRWM
ncbi:hypothetical protein SAY87_015234 [Trapa incisa]|uniref:Kinesin-like protein n=1 Tax=Trapa incisa TaxID=236973 RepID=A0AAN7GQB8_9MYRT|nr:hypothetical protein SAY87_015234 [Trapa incisa]